MYIGDRMGKGTVRWHRGFTLVELLAILVILGLITLVAVPTIVSNNKKTKERDVEEFKRTVENAAEVYVETHLDEKKIKDFKKSNSSNEAMCISTDTLTELGLLNSSLVNPETNERIGVSTHFVSITKSDNNINYSYDGCDAEDIFGSDSSSVSNYNVTYDCETNGGESCERYNEHVSPNSIPSNLKRSANKEGYVFVGWNTNKNATTGLESININKDTTLYAIYKKEEIELTAKWNANGSSLSFTTESKCTIHSVYNNAVQPASCEVNAPEITAPSSTPDIIGFNISANSNSNSSYYNVSTKKLTLTVDNNDMTWYAQTVKPAVEGKVTFDLNGNNNFIFEEKTYGESSSITICTIGATYNGISQDSSCSADIVFPEITPSDNTPSVIGWSEDESNHSAKYVSGQTVRVDSGSKYYAQTMKSAQDGIVNFNLNGNEKITYSNQDYTNDFSIKVCSIGATYNGVKQDPNCSAKITMPTITAPLATPNVLGWSVDSQSHEAVFASGKTNSLVVSGDVYYAQSEKAARPIEVTFHPNGSQKFIYNDTDYTKTTTITVCEVPATYNGEVQQENCGDNVSMPDIIPSDNTPNVIGWSIGANNHEAIYLSGEDNVTVVPGVVYYAQTMSEDVEGKVFFDPNGNEKITYLSEDYIEPMSIKICDIQATYNGEEQPASCSINLDMPTITAPLETPNVLGWSLGEEDYVASFESGQRNVSVTSGTVYYAQSEKPSVEFKATFDPNGNPKFTYDGVDYTSPSTIKICDIPASHNGNQQSDSCEEEITLPEITASENTPDVLGWSTEKDISEMIKELDISAETSESESSEDDVEDGETVESSVHNWLLEPGISGVTLQSGVTYYAQTMKESYDGEVVFDPNGNEKITYSNQDYTEPLTIQICHVEATFNGEQQADMCSVSLDMPTITASSLTPNVLGWSMDIVSHDVSFDSGQKNVMVTSGDNYFAQSMKPASEGNVTFDLNGNSKFTYNGRDYTNTKTFKLCDIPISYNGNVQTTCEGDIDIPTITAHENTPNVIGWSSDKDNHSMELESGKSSVSLTSGTVWYAQSSGEGEGDYTVIWNGNGASLSYEAGNSENDSCHVDTAYNGSIASCKVKAPNIVRNGFEIIGFDTDSNSSSNNISYNSNTQELTLNSTSTGKTWYALTKKDVNVTFEKGSNTSSIGVSGSTCTIKNSEENCSVLAPSITSNNGFVPVGWSMINGDTAGILPGERIAVDDNVTYYGNSQVDTLNVNLATSSTSSSITLTAIASATSGIKSYAYTLNGSSATCKEGTEDNICIIEGLSHDTMYEAGITITSNANNVKSETKSIKTTKIDAPTFEDTETDSGIDVSITYPSGCTDYICQYSLDEGSTWKTVTNSVYTVSFSDDGVIIARVTDKGNNSNVVLSSSHTVEISKLVNPSDLLDNVASSGDGLYFDDNNDEYYYKGASPDNYIEFSGDLWRIISINSDGNLKIIKEDRIDLTGYSGVSSSDNYKGRFDASGNTGRRTSGYCANSYALQYGCNAWAAMGNFTNAGTGDFYSSGVVTADSELNTYLNSTYKSSLSDLSYVQTNMIWNVGHAGTYNDTLSVSELEDMEKAYTWNGDIALVTKSEYIRAHGNSDCLNAKNLDDNYQNDTCKTTNYLYKSDYLYWFLSSISTHTYGMFFANSGYVSYSLANSLGVSVRPVLHLKSNITLIGSGSSTNPYKIVKVGAKETMEKLNQTPVTSGDGLYEDTSEETIRYIYKGANPKNYIYIKENGVKVRYRIYSVESDGTIKVIRNEIITSMNFDENDSTRRKTGYCTSDYCNAWTAMTGFVNGTQTGNVLGLNGNSGDSSVKEYIDGTYKNTLDDYNMITSKVWNIGGTTYNSNALEKSIADEKKSVWIGDIALLTASEYARANTNVSKCKTLLNLTNNYASCVKTNYLTGGSKNWWLLSPSSSNRYSVLSQSISGYVTSGYVYNSNGVRPAFYLTSDVELTGSGTYDEPFEIISSDNTAPTISMSPNAYSTYVSGGKAIEVTISDNDSKVAPSQVVSYAWSMSNTIEPNTWQTITTSNTTPAESTTVTIPSTSSSSLTGTYYLWIKSGIKDMLENESVSVVSNAFSFDNTEPTLSLATSSTSSSITLTAIASATSGIKSYAYTLNGSSATCKEGTEDNICIIEGLSHDTMYEAGITITSNANNVKSETKSIKTTKIDAPTFEDTETDSGIDVSITYPSGCTDYICQYSLDEGSTWKTVTNSVYTVSFSDDGVIIARVTDKGNNSNVVLSSSHTVEVLKLISPTDLLASVTSDGDGLYKDDYEEDDIEYLYRGSDPNNYINLGSDLYRIMSIDSSGNLKVIKDTPLSNMVFDPGYSSSISGITSSSSTLGTRRSSSSSDYCYKSYDSSYYGCKSWGSSTSTLNSEGKSTVTQMPWEAGSSTLKNLPTYDSYINVYLNGGEYPTSNGTTILTSWYSTNVDSSVQSKMVNHLWNVGPVGSLSSLTLALNIEQEAAYKWRGKVGLMTVTDYVRASTNSSCTNVYSYWKNSSCYNNSSSHNWLYKYSEQRIMTAASYSGSDSVWIATSDDNLRYYYTLEKDSIRPVFYLSSSILLKGKGTSAEPYNVYIEPTNVEKTLTKLKQTIKEYGTTDGDGLYKDDYEEDDIEYLYRGSDPNNYINLGSDLYRIMSIDSSGNLKVIKDTPLSNMVFDPGYSSSISGITSSSSTLGTRRSSSSSDYCYKSYDSSYYGCKSWGSSTSTLNSEGKSTVTQMPWEAGSSTLKNLPTYDSYINVYLNGGEYPTSNGTTILTSWYSTNVDSSVQSKMVNHLWNVGPVGSLSSLTLALNIEQEAAYKWRGKVGLMTVTDYVRASTNSSCINVYSYWKNSSCYNKSSTHNWLYKRSEQRTMTAASYSDSDSVWIASSDNNLRYYYTQEKDSIRPVFYLSSSISISGSGTYDDPFTVS